MNDYFVAPRSASTENVNDWFPPGVYRLFGGERAGICRGLLEVMVMALKS